MGSRVLARAGGSWSDTSNSGRCPIIRPNCGPRTTEEVPARAGGSWLGTSNSGWCPVMGPRSVVKNRQSWWSTRADVRWSCSDCLLRLARVFLGIDPSPTLVGIPWQGASFL
ncbi:hypothetical protein TIFTF001_032763, partial [Ficus carica]